MVRQWWYSGLVISIAGTQIVPWLFYGLLLDCLWCAVGLSTNTGVQGSTLPQTQTATNGTQSAGCKHCARVGQASFIKYVDRAVQTDSNSDDENRRSKNASYDVSPGLAKGQPACQSSQMVDTHQEVMNEKKRQEPKSFGHRNLKRIRHAKADDRWKEIQAPKKEVTISLANAQIRQESGSGPRRTLVAHHLWQAYVLRARALGEDVSD